MNVLIDLTSPPAQWAALGDGYRVVVRVLTREAPDATLVPVSALFPLPVNETAGPGQQCRNAPPRMAVFVVDGGHAHRVPVVLEARGSTHAWVREACRPARRWWCIRPRRWPMARGCACGHPDHAGR